MILQMLSFGPLKLVLWEHACRLQAFVIMEIIPPLVKAYFICTFLKEEVGVSK